MELTQHLADTFIAAHHLSQPERGSYASPGALRLVVATSDSILFFEDITARDYQFSLKPGLQGAADPILALLTLPGNPSAQVAFSTASGKLYLVNRHGDWVAEVKVSTSQLWHLAQAKIRGQNHLFACASSGIVHILTPSGLPVGAFAAPGPMLSLDVLETDQRILLAGGVCTAPDLYLWDVAHMAASPDHDPHTRFKGGRKPAFAARFLSPHVFVHGSWDQHLYFYHLPAPLPAATLTPKFRLAASGAVYPLTQMRLEDQSLLVAGTENGKVLAWELDPEGLPTSKERLIAQLPARVKCLANVRCGSEYLLWAGHANGFDLIRIQSAQSCQRILSVETQGEVRGIVFLP